MTTIERRKIQHYKRVHIDESVWCESMAIMCETYLSDCLGGHHAASILPPPEPDFDGSHQARRC